MTAAARTIQRIATSSIRTTASALRTATFSSLARAQFAVPTTVHRFNTVSIPRTTRAYSTEAAPTEGSSGKLLPPDFLDAAEREVFVMLAEKLEPSRLEVQDVSGGCGSMYAVEIASKRFKGLTMIKQHRLVQEILADKIKGWHGLQLKTKAE